MRNSRGQSIEGTKRKLRQSEGGERQRAFPDANCGVRFLLDYFFH
jgi:hypothetical protein